MAKREPTSQLNARRKVRNRTLIRAAKDVPCTDCGIRYAYHIMQFDHVTGVKKFNMSTGATANKSVEQLLNEIGKCQIVCANCHADRTFKREIAKGLANAC